MFTLQSISGGLRMKEFYTLTMFENYSKSLIWIWLLKWDILDYFEPLCNTTKKSERGIWVWKIISTVVKLPFDKSVHSFKFFLELSMINDSFYKCEARKAKTVVDPLCFGRAGVAEETWILVAQTFEAQPQSTRYICNPSHNSFPTVVNERTLLRRWHGQFYTIVSKWSILGY